VSKASTPQPLRGHSDLSKWIAELIHPYLKGKILELESSTGEMSDIFALAGLSFRISDKNLESCLSLKSKFEGQPLIKGIHRIDLEHSRFEEKYAQYLGRLDTIVFLNTTAYNWNNQLLWNNAKQLLRADGHMIILIPAQTAIYNEIEDVVEEWKQTNRRYIKSLLGKEIKFLKTHFFILRAINTKTFELGSQAPQFQTKDDVPYCRLGLSVLAVIKN
jgi:hypothetical protein